MDATTEQLHPGISPYRIVEFVVDPEWYRTRYPAASLAVQAGEFQDIVDYHNKLGQFEFKSPCALFAAEYYSERSKYLERAPDWSLEEDYLRYGAEQEISPHWLFDQRFLIEQLPALGEAITLKTLTGAYLYFLRIGSKTGLRPHPLFCQWTLKQEYPAIPPTELFREFANILHVKGASPGVLFDPQWYFGRYPDLTLAIDSTRRLQSAVQPFCEYGINEDRTPVPDLDIEHYRRECERRQLVHSERDTNAVWHFLFRGVQQGVNPNRFFNSTYYVEKNPSVAEEIKKYRLLGPFEHFLAIGSKRKYRANHPLVQLEVPDDFGKSLYEKRARIAAARLTNGDKLQLPVYETPTFSAIVPVFDNFAYTAWLLQQFSLYLRGNDQVSIEVIVVDNGSTDATAELEKFADGIRVVRSDRAIGYPAACNLGAQVSRGRYLVFMNNDVELLSGCFEAMLGAFADTSVGAVAGRIIKLNGTLQEAGGIVWRDGSTLGYGRGEDPLSARFMVARDVDYGSGCFLGVEAGVFRAHSGFDEVFTPGYYEETDLCARIWRSGMRVRYEPGAAIYHYEYASFSKGRPETISTALMTRNRDVFISRNREFLVEQPETDFYRGDSAAFRRGGHVRHVLLVEDFVPSEAIGSGFARTRDIVNAMLAQGWWVTIWARHKREGIEPVNDGLCETIFEPDYPEGLKGYLDDAGDSVDLVWLCRTHNFLRVGQIVHNWRSNKPLVKVVYDTEAVAAVRSFVQRELAVSDRFDVRRLYDSAPCFAVSAELKGAEYADAIVAVNELDRELISRSTGVPAFVLGHVFTPQITRASFAERQHLLFVGAVHEVGSPNYDSLVWFCNKVLPLLRRRLDGVRLRVVGYWRSSVPRPKALETPDVDFIGPADALWPHFDNARVFVAPTRVAAGIPHKVHQSMTMGVPVALTPILAEQLREMSDPADLPFFEAADFSAEAYADVVERAYLDESAWNAVRTAGIRLIEAHCNSNAFSAQISSIAAPVRRK